MEINKIIEGLIIVTENEWKLPSCFKVTGTNIGIYCIIIKGIYYIKYLKQERPRYLLEN